MGEKALPILDFDALIEAIEALSAPSGTDVAISPTGMHIVTERDVQGAISELDSAVDEVNSNLATKMIYKFSYSYTAKSVGANGNASFTADNSIPSGYTAIGIEYIHSGDYSIFVRHVNIGNGTITVHNTSNSAISTSPSLTITCVKDEMYGGSINPS